LETEKEEWISVGAVSRFPDGKKIPVLAAGKEIIVYRNGKTWFSFQRKCPHQGQALDKADLNGTILTCPFHEIKFDVESGKVIKNQGYAGIPNLQVYQIKEENGIIFIKT
jgi:nitrite reductase/ring-hydroxylating ferredoxin subunit